MRLLHRSISPHHLFDRRFFGPSEVDTSVSRKYFECVATVVVVGCGRVAKFWAYDATGKPSLAGMPVHATAAAVPTQTDDMLVNMNVQIGEY